MDMHPKSLQLSIKAILPLSKHIFPMLPIEYFAPELPTKHFPPKTFHQKLADMLYPHKHIIYTLILKTTQPHNLLSSHQFQNLRCSDVILLSVIVEYYACPLSKVNNNTFLIYVNILLIGL